MRYFLCFLFVGLASCATAPSEVEGFKLYRSGLYPEAMDNWQKAALAGDGGAAFRLGTAYLDGVVTKRNPKKAIKWIKQSAKLGDSRGEQELAAIYDCVLYKCSELGVKRSLSLAAKYYLSAARKNHAVAQYNVATMFEEGRGVQKDFVEAYKFYTLAIKNDFATFADPARDKLSYKMSRAQIELALLRAESFYNKRHTGLGGL